MQNDPRLARQVQSLYNYHVGQKAVLGKVLLIVGLASGAMFFVAFFISFMQRILVGLAAR